MYVLNRTNVRVTLKKGTTSMLVTFLFYPAAVRNMGDVLAIIMACYS